jgi:hypothetical protein
MNRRNFLGMMVGGVAAAAAVRTFPFRVFSFPSEIVTPNLIELEQWGRINWETDAKLYKLSGAQVCALELENVQESVFE